jgi:hypothetical protein
MTISRRNQFVLLAVLGVLFAYVMYLNVRGPAVSSAPSVDQKFEPLAVENPELRFELLDRLKKMQYSGSQRNIFSATLPPPPAPPPVAVKPPPPSAPPPPPPLVVPATFFGYVTDSRTGTRRAFFSEGEEVFVVGVGDVLMGRFRLVQIGNSTAELEETSSGRRATVTLVEQPGQS